MFKPCILFSVSTPTATPYKDLKNDALRENLRQRGLSTKGNKEDLVCRLIADDRARKNVSQFHVFQCSNSFNAKVRRDTVNMC